MQINYIFTKKFLMGLITIIGLNGIVYAVSKPDYQSVINAAYANYRLDHNGKNADYIPALARINPNYYGIALVTVDGKIYTVGDAQIKFPLESISKVFTLALALQQLGSNTVLEKLGATATGLPFNSVMAVEQQPNHTGNALVNAGAMATVSVIKGNSAHEKWQAINDNLNNYANTQLSLNQAVYKSEADTNQHNQAIAKLLDSYGKFYSNTIEAVDIYTKACSVDASAIDIAKMGVVLANGGKSPYTGRQLLDADYVPRVLSIMATAGLYDASGEWMYKVGLPAKSGVGGGIMAIAPGQFAVVVYSPPLDIAGNSVRGQEAIQYISNKLNANIFNPHN